MVVDEPRIVHFVDMITGEHQDVLCAVLAQDIQVLEYGVGGSAIPGFSAKTLLRWQQINELVELVAEEGPAMLQMALQIMGLVLGEYADAVHTRVHAVGQDKVDDSEFSTEGNGGLGALIRQRVQT
jgi:hypothetical protein